MINAIILRLVWFGNFLLSAKNGLNIFILRIRRTSWFNLIYFFFLFVSFILIIAAGFLCYTYLLLNTVAFDKAYYYFNTVLCFDAISLGLVFMTVTIFPWCFLYIANREDRHIWAFYLLLTEILVLLAFLSADLLFFFIIFELLIFPIYKLILGWGSPGDLRLTAARSFIIYTVLGSILLLFTIVYLHSIFGTTNIFLLRNFSWYLPDFLFFVIFVAFATKVPTFPFYHWLTLAHVEASTVGSVILAALILKLGSYGFVRFLIPLYREHLAFYLWRHLAVSLFIISMLFASIAAITQTDIKRIVAYSSIEHINLSIIGLALCSTTSVMGAYAIMLAHGWVAAGLFFAVGWVYDSRHQRDILYYRGYAIIEGWWSVLFGLLLLANIGFPLTLNFFGEFQILLDLFGQYTELLALVFFVMIANIVYTLKLGSIMWGTPHTYLLNTQVLDSNVNTSEFIYSQLNSNTYKRIARLALLFALLGLPLLLVVLLGHPEFYPNINILLEKTFRFWHLTSIQTSWPWSIAKWF